MADDGFSLTDALAGQNAANAQQSQGQSWPGWGNQNPGAGQQYPGFPGQPYQGQQYPGAPAQPGAPPAAGQQYPGGPGAPPAAGQQYPGFPGPGQQYPGFPGSGQQYPGAPGAPPAAGQQYPGGPTAPPAAGQQYPGFPAPGQQYPGFPGPGQQYPGAPGQPATPSIPLKVPYNLPLQSGLVPRQMISIAGVVNPNAKRFVIDFRKGSDIVFHLNPRFDERPNVVVRNSMLRDQWGKEERQAHKFPFSQGKPFKIQVLCEPDKYNVMVNNENLFQYNHRVRELHEIKQIAISGDVSLTDVSLTMV